MTNAEARFNNSLCPRKPDGSLGRTAQDGHLDSHTAPELWFKSLVIARLSILQLDAHAHFSGVRSLYISTFRSWVFMCKILLLRSLYIYMYSHHTAQS